jgi:hypothetical protein
MYQSVLPHGNKSQCRDTGQEGHQVEICFGATLVSSHHIEELEKSARSRRVALDTNATSVHFDCQEELELSAIDP